MQPLLITQQCALGDNILLTAAVRDLALAHPGRFEIHVRTHCPALWQHNPHIASWKGDPPKGATLLPIVYGPYIKEADHTKLHFLTAFHRFLEDRLKVPVPVTLPQADLWLSPEQESKRPIDQPYWLLLAGGKRDATVKIWSAHYAQQLVDYLHEEGIAVVQEGDPKDLHPCLQGVLRTPPTNYMELLWLVRHAEGVICPITAAMHAAAAFERPCVVTAGGREHWWWEGYLNVPEQTFGPQAQPVAVPHRYLHTQDQLPCCQGKGCWKNKVQRTEPDKEGYHCQFPARDARGQYLPLCQKMLKPADVGRAVLSYYHDGTLHRKTDTVCPKWSTAFLDRPGVNKEDLSHDPLDIPVIGGVVACGIILQGLDSDQDVLEALCRNTPNHRIRLLVAGQATPAVRTQLQQLLFDCSLRPDDIYPAGHGSAGQILKAWMDLLDLPRWLLWFEGAKVGLDPTWLSGLAVTIQRSSPATRLLGALTPHVYTSTERQWIQSRPWYRGRPFQLANGNESTEGDCVFTPSGGFFAIDTQAAKAAGIPDPEQPDALWCWAEQLRQAGYTTRRWNQEQQFVRDFT